MQTYISKENPNEILQAFQWNGSHDSIQGLGIPEENSDPNSGIINLKTASGIEQVHMGYYLVKTGEAWSTINPDYFAAHYELAG